MRGWRAGDNPGTGRDLLFSDPAASLPDVYISTSVRHVQEGEAFAYTVQLTHQPGMREDETVDLLNDEVRIYLTSSQEVYQQDDEGGVGFKQRVGHRTQLEINTNVASVTESAAGLVTAVTPRAEAATADPPKDQHMGPVPYVYVAYSTKNPAQASPKIDLAHAPYGTGTGPRANFDNYKVVCPLCTHEAYCTQLEAIIPGTAFTAADNADTEVQEEFDGCLDILYNGFAPVYDSCSENAAAIRASASGAYTTEVYVGYMVKSAVDPTAAALTDTLGEQVVVALADQTKGSQLAYTGSDPSHDSKPNGPAPGVPFGNTNFQKYGCYPAVASFDGMHSLVSTVDTPGAATAVVASTSPILRRVPMGGEDPAWLQHVECWDKIAGVWADCAGKLEAVSTTGAEPTAVELCKSASTAWKGEAGVTARTDWANCKAGNSDFRIRADGSPVLRDTPRIDTYCRYCDRPGLLCDTDGDLTDPNRVYGTVHIFDPATSPPAPPAAGASTLYGRECIKDTINGGDTAPNLRNWKLTSYASGPSWRGDLSSGAQLVFDSTNWNTPQTVVVTARDDDVYEPEVFGRGQDAYVHHYVVAQDINLQHTYYEDIDVNDVVVSITDDDPAVVIEELDSVTPVEGGTSPDVKIKLASEPMYDVTVYVQSGAFLDGDGSVLPDDEQVIYQDKGQFEVCFDAVTGLRKVTAAAAVDNSVGGAHTNDCSEIKQDLDAASAYAGGANTKRQGWDGRESVRACDASGVFVRPEGYKDSAYDYANGVPGLPTGWICPSHTDEAACTGEDSAAGCAWQSAYNVWVEPSAGAGTNVCVAWDDLHVGNTAAEVANTDSPPTMGPATTDPAHDGTLYPATVTDVASQADCEDVGTRFWTDASGCTNAAGVVQPEYKTEATCTKTGKTFIGGQSGVCKDVHGIYLDALTTAAACVGTDVATATIDALLDASADPSVRGHCVDAMVGRHTDTLGQARPTKSMDIVCQQNQDTASCTAAEGCFWDATITGTIWPMTAGGLCKAEKLGFDCNSYLVFTSTNWGTYQTLSAIAVQDDEDETAAADGTDVSEIGYLYTSRDWYYNSAGSEKLADEKTDYVSSAAAWSPGTPDGAGTVKLSMFDTRFGLHINRYPWTAGDTSTAAAALTGVTALAGVSGRTSMQNGRAATVESCEVADPTDTTTSCTFTAATDSTAAAIDAAKLTCPTGCVYTPPQDTGVADADINAAASTGVLDVRTQGQIYKDDGKHVHNEYGVSTWVDYLRDPVSDHQGAAVTTLGGHVDEPDGFLEEPNYGFLVDKPHSTSANNLVCRASIAEQVTTFDPASYANQGATCGATAQVTDKNLRQVLISRSECQATEGRRFYHKNFNHQKNPTDLEWNGHVRTYTNMGSTAAAHHSFGSQHRTEAPSKLPVTLGIFTDDANHLADTDINAPSDLWTAEYLLRSEAALYGGGSMLEMSMPVCPFTIVLEAAPLEGATVVVKVFEDPELTALRDNELYFFEEPTFRPGIISEDECEHHFPGSDWIAAHDGGSCFIQNVPYVTGMDPTGLGFQPRGGTTLDVMFTDQDWDVPRRITVIALNDDVDEPQETRKVFFDTAPCTGTNHNPGTGSGHTNHGTPSGGETCIEDPLYNDANIYTTSGIPSGSSSKDYIEVTVVDDDIADLVVLCGDNAGGTGDDLDVTGSRVAAFVDSCSEATTASDCLALSGCVWTGVVCAFDYEDDEVFIGSYDDSHPSNRWCDATISVLRSRCLRSQPVCVDRDEQVERRGADAEDGMSYSKFGGGVSTFFDGITGQAGASDCPNCGYVSIVESNADSTEALMNRNRCIVRTTLDLSTLVESSVAPPPAFPANEVYGQTTPTAPTPTAGKTEEGCYPDTTAVWQSYDPYTDTYCTSANTGETYGPHCGGWGTTGLADPANHVDTTAHVRGFKGKGPAYTEDDDNYVCTIHSRECKEINGALKDAENEACEYGTFQVRLNSSPGTKKVRRQYIGTGETETEEEAVYIVIRPDPTPQTTFDPPAVTFTHAGGSVDGSDTNRWDEPAEIKVVPVDDDVDERMGVIVDFTAFTITQSHKFDEYWKYTTPYMRTADSSYELGGEDPNVGSMCEWATTAATGNAGWVFGSGCTGGSGVNEATTPYRHTIRTIHTMDNDFSGVRIESAASGAATDFAQYDSTGDGSADAGFSASAELPACTSGECVKATQTVDAGNPNYHTHLPSPLFVEEGSTFTYYTLQLDTQPRKIQRQSGTKPNLAIDFNAHTSCFDVGSDQTYDGPGAGAGEFFGDWTDRTRPTVCGSVEPRQDYWVDVTASQTVHVDLAEPASCPAGSDTPWGGGSAPTTTSRHPRFPFNAKSGQPIDELVDAPSSMDGYLTTCGGWQRDATFRFTADNWNIPQFVYVYAHNDKDSYDIKNAEMAGADPSVTAHVAYGGNEQSDASVGHDPQPQLDSDGRVASDYGISYGLSICKPHGDQTNCEAEAGCVWDATECKWDGSRPAYFDRSLAKAADTYTTVLRHYVETQDTLDNMQGTGFVQWNKHGGIYTYGNLERFPFGVNRYSGAPEYGKLDETGSSTWGYSKYESLYGYGYYKDGLWTTEGCCSTAMGGNWGTPSGGVDIWGTSGPSGREGGIGGTDTNSLGHEFGWTTNSQNPTAADAATQCRFAVSQRDLDTYSQRQKGGTAQADYADADVAGDRWRGPGEFTRGSGQISSSAGATQKASQVPANGAGDCFDMISGLKLPRPYFRAERGPAGGRIDAPVDGGCGSASTDAACHLIAGCAWDGSACNFDASWWEGVPDGAFCTPVANDQFCVPRFATSYQTNVESEYTLQHRLSTDRSTGDAMKFPPLNVWIAIKDTDAQSDMTTSDTKSTCRQTTMFQFADAEGSGSGAVHGLQSSKWLTDYNCVPDEAGRLDGGVLPGYPVDTSLPPEPEPGVADPDGLTPNVRVGTENMGFARIDGGAHLCATAEVFCPSGASALPSTCQTDCTGCTGFTTNPTDHTNTAADICV